MYHHNSNGGEKPFNVGDYHTIAANTCSVAWPPQDYKLLREQAYISRTLYLVVI